MPEKLKFRISSALKNVIGRDLIIDDFVAIFELVKNSFDAFASKVFIQFDFKVEADSKIYIIDDGKGMSYDDIIEKWLFVAFSAKKEGTEDKIRRTYAGNKGVGRFSCDRLGLTLKIQSKTKSDKKIHCLDINWEDFEKNSKEEFVEIDVIYTESGKFSIPGDLPVNESGVVLEIGNLRHEFSWNRDKLIRLKRSLEKLIDPIPDVETQRDIEIICETEKINDADEIIKAVKKDKEQITVNGIIKNKILEVLEDKTTVIKAMITDEKKLQVELIDRGVFIYKTEEDISNVFPNLINSGFYTEISFLNRSAKQTFALRMGVPSVQYGSIFLIMNGFRVFPIGEDGNDYWGLDRRKQQKYASYLGSRDLLGFVKIMGGDYKFRESSSRNQGLIQTQSAIELTECFLKCIRKFEAYVTDITWKDKLDKDEIDFKRMGLDNNRIRIIQLIEKLAKSKNITVLDYNRDLISIMDKKSKEFEPSLKNLKNIADNINDEKLSKQIDLAEKALIKAKKAEQEANKAADRERIAREKAEKIAKIVEEEKEVIEDAYKEEKKRNLFLTGSRTRDKELLECFIHQIIIYASNSKETLKNILQSPTRFNNLEGEELSNLLENLLEITDKIISTSRFATTANFRLNSSMITEDFNAFMLEYLETIAVAYNTRIKIHTKFDTNEFELNFNPIEMGMVFENFISNSKKARASNITFASTYSWFIDGQCF